MRMPVGFDGPCARLISIVRCSSLSADRMFKAHTLKLTYLLCAVLLTPQLSPLAQTKDKPSARKVDEFPDIQASALIARLDNLAIELQNEPDAKCFLIVYRSRRDLPGLSNRYAHRMKSYLISSRGIAPDRIVTVDGGVASCLSQELWIVPRGAAPQPRADAYSDSYQPSSYKFDEHYYNLPNDPADNSSWAVPPDYLFGYLEAFAQALQKEAGSSGYLIAFKAVDRDRPGVAQGMLAKERGFLIRRFGIKPSRIKTVDGGYREWRTMELWIVRRGDYTPVITSYSISRNRRRR